MPVYNTPPNLLAQAIDSVRKQVYENWELCIQDDGSTSKRTLDYLELISTQDQRRIHIGRSPSNQGISAATNAALGQAGGEFVAMVDHDDVLTENCLEEIIAAYNRNPDADVFYTDQAYIDDQGSPTQPLYKPNWSPWMFRGVMFVGHLLVVRRTIAQSIRGFDTAFDFVQDFEFMLRVSEKTDRIIHLPKVLYYWRQTPTSVAGGGKREIDFGRLQSEAVNAHLNRLQLPVLAEAHPTQPHRVMLTPAQNEVSSSIRVLVTPPSLNEERSLDESMDRLMESTSYCNVKWTRVSPDEMRDPSGLAPLLEDCDCDIWVFVNGLCQPTRKDWLSYLSGCVRLPGIGTVGPHIVGKDGTIASAGMILSDKGVCAAMTGLEVESDGYAGSLSCLREVSALSPDCIGLRKDLLRLQGALWPEWGLAYNLLDLGIRSRLAGLTNLVAPLVQVRWLGEPRSCINGNSVGERFWRSFRRLELAKGDPFFNPNLDLLSGGYTSRSQPRVAAEK